MLLDAGLPVAVASVISGVVLAAKLVQALHAYIRQGRKECLELWDRSKVDDAFWLESYINHRYNVRSPPADLVRACLKAANSTAMVRDLVMNWRFFQGSSLQALRWRVARRNRPVLLAIELAMLPLAYFVFVVLGLLVIGKGGEKGIVAACPLIALGAMSFWTFLTLIGARRALADLRRRDEAEERASMSHPPADTCEALG